MKVNEIFYSLQGEGRNAGRAAIFVRFSGCNLHCDFCDTNHRPYKEYTEDEIMREIAKYPAKLVVFTGGEPTLQLTESLVDKCHNIGKVVAIETNGTRRVPKNVDWVTVSPKTAYVGVAGRTHLFKADEVKVVYDGKHDCKEQAHGITADYYYVQPCDTGDQERNKEIVAQCVAFVQDNPEWALSVQTHKIIGVR